MRNLFDLRHHHHVLALPPVAAPSPTPFSSLQFPNKHFFFPSIYAAEGILDLSTISVIAVLFILSIVAFSTIIHLRLRSRRLHHLQNFNSLWTVRLLLVSLGPLWAVNEIIRLPYIRQKFLYPFLPNITLNQQTSICKLHAVLSLGFFEPCFLITLLFLVNFSIKRINPGGMRAFLFVLIFCSPITILQIMIVYFSPFGSHMLKFMHGSFFFSTDQFGNKMVLCTYPFFSCVVFGMFSIVYAMAFFASCCRMMSLVINKGIRKRINYLAATVMVVMLIQIICLSMAWVWMPEDTIYGCLMLAMFVCVAFCMGIGEVILVIKPVVDALVVGLERPKEAGVYGDGL